MLLQAVDFCQDILRPGFHFKIGQVAVCMFHDPEPVLYGIQHLQHAR